MAKGSKDGGKGKVGKDEDKLETFKIADKKRPEVRSFKATAGAAPAPPPSPSVGFPAIEARLEKATIESVANELRTSYEQLEKLATSGNMKTKAAAKKAMGAYERAADLFEYLFATKAGMQAPSPK
jgi:hypothetical protein